MHSVKGTWKMEIIGGVDNGNGVKDHWGISLTGVPENLKQIGFMGRQSSYKLLVAYNDPDEGAVMIFTKP
jgi:hypothetical protein